MDNQTMAKIEAEVGAALETEMREFCTRKGIVQGWSVAQHAQFQHGQLMDVIETAGAIEEDEVKFRVFIILRKTANYSAWRQAHEGDGKPLAKGAGRGSKSLLAEYED